MLSDYDLAQYALLGYDEPNIVVDNAQAYIGIDDGTTIVAPAGTNDFKDAWADLKALPWRPAELNVWLHAGMWFHAKKLIKPVMAQIIANDLPVRYVGHSLGAQVGGMLAVLSIKYGYNVVDWTTFGCPRGGFGGYNELTRMIPGKRFLREGDQIGAVPTLFGWSHDREATILPGSDGIIDHLMKDYLEVISD